MDLSTYFEPIRREAIDFLEGYSTASIGASLSAYWAEGGFPDWENARVALIGVCEERGSVDNSGCATAPDAVRRKLYRLASPAEELQMVDLGNILPGKCLEDTLFALEEVLSELLSREIVTIILGGSQDLTFGQYRGYVRQSRVANGGSIDARIDIEASERVNAHSWLYNITTHAPNYLFDFVNIGYQSYFVERELVSLMEDLGYSTYRLGTVQGNLKRAETILRGIDFLSVDVGAVRHSDCPGQPDPSPHGFYGEELCQMARYAGMADKLTSIGFYELNPRYDNRYQSAHMVAHAIWYFIEGYHNRVYDFPYRDKENYRRYLVALTPAAMVGDLPMVGDFLHADGHNNEIVFVKSKKTERWWMEVPCNLDERRERYQHHLLVPCAYEDYELAMKGDIPEAWLKAYKRVNDF